MSIQNAAPDQRNLDRAFLGGLAWTAGAKWLSQLISWPSVLITARLLSPADYGLVEMSGMYFIVTNVLAEFGIGMAVLQLRELEEETIAQLNTVASLSGLVGFAFSVAAAPLIASFFRAPDLYLLVIVSSLSFIITSLEAIPLGLLQRDMDYRRLSMTESLQAVITAVVCVGSAYAGWGYWSLVAGNLAGRAGNVALACYFRPVRFGLPRAPQIAGPLRFGFEIAAQRLAGSVNLLSDVFVIGRTLGEAPLGAYRFATSLANTPTEKIGALIMRVTGPLFARVQADREALKRYLLIFTEALSIAIFPLVFGLGTLAAETIDLLLGSKWQAAAAPLRWLSFFMALRSIGYILSQLLVSLRFLKFGRTVAAINFCCLPLGFFIASRWGLGAVAAVWTITAPITILPMAIKVCRALNCSAVRYLSSLAPAIVGSALMVYAIITARPHLPASGWKTLGIEVALGALVYLVVLFSLFRERVLRFYRILTELRNNGQVSSS